MLITKDVKMADVIHENYLLVSVINRFGISLGFADQSIEELCQTRNINLDFFLEILNTFLNQDYFPELQLQTFSIQLIVSYLRKTHSYYLREKIPQIAQQIEKISSKNENQENYILLKNFFSEYISELTNHIQHEEKNIYPYALEIEQIFHNQKELTKKNLPRIKEHTIKSYALEHSDIEIKLLDLKNIIIKYLPPPVGENNSYNSILFELFKLENDLNDHSRIEEKVMIPKVYAMEKEILKRYNII